MSTTSNTDRLQELNKMRDAYTEARKLIENEEHWTQEVYARNKDGFSVDPFSEYAVCWCMSGAIRKAIKLNTSTCITPLLYNAHSILVTCARALSLEVISVPELNDYNEHEVVLKVFDCGIEYLTQEIDSMDAGNLT